MGLAPLPEIAEDLLVLRDLAILKYSESKLHISTISTSESVDIIKLFKDKGVDITCEITPHHLCLSDEILFDYNTNSKVAPPIRSKANQKKLVNAVKSGIIDCIATDHAPHSIDDKETDICSAACGMIGMETAFSLSLGF